MALPRRECHSRQRVGTRDTTRTMRPPSHSCSSSRGSATVAVIRFMADMNIAVATSSSCSKDRTSFKNDRTATASALNGGCQTPMTLCSPVQDWPIRCTFIHFADGRSQKASRSLSAPPRICSGTCTGQKAPHVSNALRLHVWMQLVGEASCEPMATLHIRPSLPSMHREALRSRGAILIQLMSRSHPDLAWAP